MGVLTYFMAILEDNLLDAEKRQLGVVRKVPSAKQVDPCCRSPTKDEHPKSFTKVTSILHISDRKQPETW